MALRLLPDPNAREQGRIALGKKISVGVTRAWARRNADKIAPTIMLMLADLGRLEIDIPETWHPFIPPDILKGWPSVAHAMGLLMELHRQWDRERQEAWLANIRATHFELVGLPQQIAETDLRFGELRRRFEAGEFGNEPTIPDDDLTALADLA